MLENLKVQCYGEKHPIATIAQVSQKSQGILQVTVFEESLVSDVIKVLPP